MSSHSRPTCGIWRKWSISHRLVKPASSAARATSASAPAPSGPSHPKRETWSPNSSGTGSAPWRAAASGRAQERGWHERDRPGVVDAREALARERLARAGGLAQLGGDDLGGHRRPAGPVALAHDLLRRVEHDRVGRHALALGERPPGGAPLRLEPGRVHHGREAAAQALRDDQVEHLERVAARALVALARADHRPQAIRGHDLVRVEPGGRPRRLARPGRPDQDHEAGIG